MTKTKKNISRLLGNKFLWILVSSILVFIIAFFQIDRYRKVHSPLYTNLQGTYDMLLDSAIIDRPFDMQPLGFFLYINGWNITLPPFDCITPYVMGGLKYQEICKIDDDRYGSWKIVSTNPDSIFIEAYPHVFHGKYKVMFSTCPEGSLGYGIANYLFLDNDSTHLCFKKTN